tara:strand:+ start:349 stop:606 length:258 start_codon:yes stop_codon:yes gene_type:complete
MKNKDILKKQILYRSMHRGTKEMDLLLGNFVSKYINSFSEIELKDLKLLMEIDDEVLHSWYFNNVKNNIIPNNQITKKLKNFKLS